MDICQSIGHSVSAKSHRIEMESLTPERHSLHAIYYLCWDVSVSIFTTLPFVVNNYMFCITFFYSAMRHNPFSLPARGMPTPRQWPWATGWNAPASQPTPMWTKPCRYSTVRGPQTCSCEGHITFPFSDGGRGQFVTEKMWRSQGCLNVNIYCFPESHT